MYLAPIVTNCIGKIASISAKGGGRDGGSAFKEWLQSLFAVFVPKVECSITSSSRECSPNRVETNCIYRINIIALSVAFESKIFAIKKN
jgi:hypothetical protein